jgi:hypothetical protein
MAPAVERTIDRDALVRIERSGGYQAKTGKYALIGGLLGVAAGTAIGYVAAMGDESAGPLITAPITFGVAGTLVGAACGAAAGGERWTEVPTDSKVGLQLGAPSLPLAVGVRVSF